MDMHFYFFAFEVGRESEVERERWWDCSFYFPVPLKNERSVPCEGMG